MVDFLRKKVLLSRPAGLNLVVLNCLFLQFMAVYGADDLSSAFSLVITLSINIFLPLVPVHTASV